MTMRYALALTAVLLLGGCSTPTPQPSSDHITQENAPPAPEPSIPQPVESTASLPKPKPAQRLETYSVVVNNVKVQDLLFALARDAKINVDVHPGLNGTVTLNAIDQTLPQLLSRIARQVDMRYEMDGPNLMVMPDSPYLHTYKVDYVNLSRDTSGTVNISTQITSGGTSSSGGGSVAGGSLGGSNNSTTEVKNTAHNRFWESLEKNIKDILRETDKILPEGSSETVIETEDLQNTTGTGVPPATTRSRAAQTNGAIIASPNPATVQSSGTQVVRRTTFREAASVIVNPESGIITVRATGRQHEKVQEFLDNVVSSAKRQVLIEATIAEVTLSDGYQQGIDWARIYNGTTTQRFGISSASLGDNPTSSVTPFIFRYNTLGNSLNIASTVTLLQQFGTVKVLSSPKLSVLNNQTALLKVVDNIVYFEVKADTTTTANVGTTVAFTTTPRSVSVGLVMSVTPQISDSNAIVLNVRPTISRVTGFVTDPNPQLVDVINRVPQIQTREMESVLRLTNGDVAVLGGLMEDRVDLKTGRVPGLGDIPFLGEIFTSRNNATQKTELVIFLRPVVIKDASLNGDYSAYRDRLPGSNYFGNNPNPPLPFPGGHRGDAK